MGPVDQIQKYVRAANYLSGIQIYLKDNFLLERALVPDDVKPRLLGHWGTCPGINFVYANLNYLAKKHALDMMFILGPGHGFPALQANLFLEGSLEHVGGPKPNFEGLGELAKKFSWPHGFPSHSNPEAPGVILEGGELGYALSTAYGSVLDNPDLITSVLVGDGEAETAATATAWHLSKFISPKGNGAVLPILHLNGYKISGPTIFGRMDRSELLSLFHGYGYDVIFVEGDSLYQKMLDSLELAYQSIKAIQQRYRSGDERPSPRMPMIILKTEKGWTGIKELHGVKIVGNYASHQVPAPKAKEDPEELKLVEDWLRSYNFQELFSKDSGFIEDVKSLIPGSPMGQNYHTFGGEKVLTPLHLPDLAEFKIDLDTRGQQDGSSMEIAGEYLNKVFTLNSEEKNFRLMSPDETYSNKLAAVFQSTQRAFVWPREDWDKDMSPDGRVMEMLSEHSLQGLMQGYVLTGRHAVFASYEAFISTVGSMVDQYAKFMHISRQIDWHGEVPSLNYILTSSGWEQEHNGFSHQNPGFIDDMLQRQGCFINAFFPADANSLLATLDYCLKTTQQINIIISGKKTDTNWQSLEEAQKQMERGMAIWDFASDEDPDIVFCGIGDYITKESLVAVDILKNELPETKIRFINVSTLTALGVGHEDCRIDFADFEDFFTSDKPVIINFHGYPQTIKQMFFDYEIDTKRFSVHGYLEIGSTTTPFDMQVRNQTSRYHLVIEAVNTLAAYAKISQEKALELSQKFTQKLKDHKAYIMEHGVDPEEIENWHWSRNG